MLQNIKSTVATIAILGLIGLGVGVGASADTEATVSATVCPILIAVTVSPNTVDYGIQALGGTDLVPNPTSVTIKNSGNVEENFLVKGGDAITTGGSWTLAGTAGIDAYVHKSSPDNSNFTDLTTSNASLVTNISGDTACDGTTGDGGTQFLFLKMDTPTISTEPGQYSAPVTITATAA